VAGVEEDFLPALEVTSDAVRPAERMRPPIVLNEWTARDLGARVGDEVALEFYVWREEGRLETRNAAFRLTGVVPIAGPAADRAPVPDCPDRLGAPKGGAGAPPFPVDLSKIRPVDEKYWDAYRTTPKAFIPLGAAQSLWNNRLGRLTSIRFTPEDGVALVDA